MDRALATAGLPPRPAEVARPRQRPGVDAGTHRQPPCARGGDLRPRRRQHRRPERGLPHYGAQSWLVFEGGRAISRGTWPASLLAVPVVRR